MISWCNEKMIQWYNDIMIQSYHDSMIQRYHVTVKNELMILMVISIAMEEFIVIPLYRGGSWHWDIPTSLWLELRSHGLMNWDTLHVSMSINVNICKYIYIYTYVYTCGFPEMGVPLNHPFWWDFPLSTIYFGGILYGCTILVKQYEYTNPLIWINYWYNMETIQKAKILGWWMQWEQHADIQNDHLNIVAPNIAMQNHPFE